MSKSTWTSPMIGAVAGMLRYHHLLKINVDVISSKVDAVVMAALFGAAGYLGKELLKLAIKAFKAQIVPSFKLFFKRKIFNMNTQNPLFLFLVELVSRWRATSPKFFRVWQTISMIVAAITGLPGLITSFGIELPPAVVTVESKIVFVASLCIYIMSKLTVQSTPVLVTGDSVVLKKTDNGKLPFTAAGELKDAIRQGSAVTESKLSDVVNN